MGAAQLLSYIGGDYYEKINVLIALVLCLTISSVYATWIYSKTDDVADIRRETTVNGVEMALYITAADLHNVSSGRAVVVYAASFTKLPGSDAG